MNLTEYYKFRALMGNISGGGGSDGEETTVTIFDGEIELTYDIEWDESDYYGSFTPENKPEKDYGLTIEINGVVYETNSGETYGEEINWRDSGSVNVWESFNDRTNRYIYTLYINKNIMPSDDNPQTVSVKITQVQSSGGGSTDDSFAKLIDRSIVTVVIPDGVTSIGDSAFYGCSSLESVTIPDSVTIINNQGFRGCENLEEIHIPNNVESIGNNTFYGCSSLTDVIIPDSVTTIGAGAFTNCTGLINVEISGSIEEIYMSTFSGCTSLESITCYAITPPTLGTNAFKNVPADCAIYVPAESVDTYKATAGWSGRAAYIQAIESDDEEDEV